jgi:hypothetical protein
MPEGRTKMKGWLAKGLAVASSLTTVYLLGSGVAVAVPTDAFCVPDQVVVFADAPRQHVHCAASVGGISYFAISTVETSLAARVLSILTTAQVAGRTLVIRYDPADTSGTSIGCQANDCRLIFAVGFGQ